MIDMEPRKITAKWVGQSLPDKKFPRSKGKKSSGLIVTASKGGGVSVSFDFSGCPEETLPYTLRQGREKWFAKVRRALAKPCNRNGWIIVQPGGQTGPELIVVPAASDLAYALESQTGTPRPPTVEPDKPNGVGVLHTVYLTRGELVSRLRLAGIEIPDLGPRLHVTTSDVNSQCDNCEGRQGVAVTDLTVEWRG